MSLSDFVDAVSNFQVNVPLWLQIIIIIIVILSLCGGAYFMRDLFEMTYMKEGFAWFIFIAILNLISLLVIFIYYSKKNNTYVGPQGKPGKKGKGGKQGSFVSCSFCKNNIYIQSVRKSDIICTLSTYTEEFKTINQNAAYFDNIISQGNNINYDSFVNNIILGEPNKDPTSNQSISNFRSLMTTNSIAVSLIKVINSEITKASDRTYGTFRSPVNPVGYVALGDSVYGGLEKFELLSFTINGNVLYPDHYEKLVTFKSYNETTEKTDTYTIWRPVGQTVTEPGFKNKPKKFKYKSLGDICRSGTKPPLVSDCATVREDCLDLVDGSDLTLVFIYVGNLQFNDNKNTVDYTKADSYLIKNKVANDIEIYSVWRTPLNTFVTNCNSKNVLENNSVAYNINNNILSGLNEYGNVSKDTKARISNILQGIQIPKILTAMILCKYYELDLTKELIYYFNKYQSVVPEFGGTNTSSASLGDLITTIKNTQKAYTDFNNNLMKKASFTLKGSKPYLYNANDEKHLPPSLLLIYNRINDNLLTISVQIENTNTLLDIVNLVFENGISARVAIDSDGIAEGGVLLNEIQDTVLRLCKILLPPNYQAYTIKDECLGTFGLDKERQEIIKELTETIDTYNKINDEISTDSSKYESVATNIRNYQSYMDSQVGQLCGYIDNYQTKINNMDLEQFTTTRLKGLIKIYNNMNINVNTIMKNL